MTWTTFSWAVALNCPRLGRILFFDCVTATLISFYSGIIQRAPYEVFSHANGTIKEQAVAA